MNFFVTEHGDQFRRLTQSSM